MNGSSSSRSVDVPVRTSHGGRGNERMISSVVHTLTKWKKLHDHGASDPAAAATGEHTTRLTWGQAATFINVPKKTLDDYMREVRMGHRNGFDFDQNSSKRFGVLRAFNRRRRERERLGESEHVEPTGIGQQNQ